MIQDISPKSYQNTYLDQEVTPNAVALIYQNNEILLKNMSGSWQLPLIHDLNKAYEAKELINQLKDGKANQARFAFRIDDQDFFLIDASWFEQQIQAQGNQVAEFQFHKLQTLRTLRPMWMAFAGITGSQLYRFYQKKKYCGQCGVQMIHSSTERAMTCPNCSNIVYPPISPAVIVAVTNKEKLLMTKYANREYTNYALVAGFVEVGETLEQCVAREVKEEVGLEVTNIRYFKSQPWSFSDSLLAGFFAECNESDQIILDTNELSTAEWVERTNIPPKVNDISLTQEMIEAFRNHEIK